MDPDPELTTYDDSAWTLALMTHTQIKPTDDIAVQAVAVDPVDNDDPQGSVSGTLHAIVYAVPDHGSPNLVTLRYALKEAAVQIAEKPFTVAGTTFAAGTFLVPASAAETLKPMAKELGLDVVGLAAQPQVVAHPAALPRVAIFSAWNGTQDVGWVRYTFDQYKIPYDLIFKERVLQGDLAKDYDLILIPNEVRSAKALVIGIPTGDKPLAYEKTARFKFLGDYCSSPDITGGMGATGVAELEKSNSDLKAQAARMVRKTLPPMVSAILAKGGTDTDGERIEKGVLDKTLQSLSVEQRIAVKAELARAGMIE